MQRSRWVGIATVVVTVGAPLAATLTPPSPAFGANRPAHAHAVAVRGDFDGDGKADFVAAAVGGKRVRLSYTKAKPAGSHAQWISAPIANAFAFGAALAVGDFNGDGFADLAIGAPGYQDSDGTEQGAVFIYDGSKSGLRYTGTVFKGPDTFDDDNAFGNALATADLNGDGFAELAVGNPGPGGGGDGQGSVTILFGSTAGLTTAGRVFVPSAHPLENGNFGTSVAFADVNGDGHKDLIVGEVGGGRRISKLSANAGDVQVFYGNATGLGTKHTTIQGSMVGASGLLGSALATGDINHDGFADVVVGAPDAIVKGKLGAGRVVVFAGGKHGLSASRRQVFSEATPHVPGAVATRDFFGGAISVGDLTGDRRAEVVVGAIGVTVAGHRSAGAVYVFRGTKSGVAAAGCRRITQGSKGVPGAPLTRAFFGLAVATRAVSASGHRVLMVGIPHRPKGGLVMVARLKSTLAIAKPVRLVRDTKIGDGLGSGFAA